MLSKHFPEINNSFFYLLNNLMFYNDFLLKKIKADRFNANNINGIKNAFT